VNMSLGGGAYSPLNDAITNLVNDGGVHVVVAAGNSDANACNYSPAMVSEAITVGSTTSADDRSSFSNKGKCVDIFAPGSDIKSTWIGSSIATRTISGTSMASPHVCGAVALYLSDNQGLSTDEVRNKLLADATEGKIRNLGGSPDKLLYVGEIVSQPTPFPVSSPVSRPSSSSPVSLPSSSSPVSLPTTRAPVSSPVSPPTLRPTTRAPVSSPVSPPTLRPTTRAPVSSPVSRPTSNPSNAPVSSGPTASNCAAFCYQNDNARFLWKFKNKEPVYSTCEELAVMKTKKIKKACQKERKSRNGFGPASVHCRVTCSVHKTTECQGAR